MDLGQKLKTARLEAGLSQRQLCGDIITRNMLSQIENGNAKPSYATLQALCAKLGKPVSYFWEDAPSQNLALLHKAQSAPAEEALALLDGYLSPDPLLDTARPYVADFKLGDAVSAEEAKAKLEGILRNTTIFGVDLIEVGLADLVCKYFVELIAGKGAVRATLKKYLAEA